MKKHLRLPWFIGFLVLLIIGYHGAEAAVESNAVKTQNDCGTSSQFLNIPPSATQSNHIIARILNVEPFAIEILDAEQSSSNLQSSLFSSFYPYPYYFEKSRSGFVNIAHGEKDKISPLRFNDIISADIFEYEVDPTYEYALMLPTHCAALTNIKIMEQPVSYFNPPQIPFLNRSGLLIIYQWRLHDEYKFMAIFNDGKVSYYPDSPHAPKKMKRKELNHLLALFSQSNFERIPADFSAGIPSLTLIQNGYHPISLDKNESNTKLITKKLKQIYALHIKNAFYGLGYRRKYAVKDWTYGTILPLDQANIKAFSQENKSKLSQLTLPQELINSAGSFNNYYKYKRKIYTVWFGECGTWECYLVDELEYDIRPRGKTSYRPWPKTLKSRLKDISGPGIDSAIRIPKDEFTRYKRFYKKLLIGEANGPHVLFFEDGFLYELIRFLS